MLKGKWIKLPDLLVASWRIHLVDPLGSKRSPAPAWFPAAQAADKKSFLVRQVFQQWRQNPLQPS